MVLSSQFDTEGDRTSLAATIDGAADFINSYSYDALSRMTVVQQQGQTGGNVVSPKEVDLSYNGIGQITQTIDYDFIGTGPRADIATGAYSYNTQGLLAGIDYTGYGGADQFDNLGWTYDPLARVSTFTSIDGTATYGYDNTSQIVSAAYTTATGGHQPADVSYTWDANGNNAAPGNVVSSNNEVTNDGTFTYTFDANGNRTSRQRISTDPASDYLVTYTWDYRNRLTDVEFYDNNSVLTKHVHYVYGVYDNLIGEDIDSTGSGTYDTTENFVLDVTPKLPVQVLSLSGAIDASAPPDVLLEFVNGDLAYRFLSAPSPPGVDAIFAQGAVASLTQPDVVTWPLVNNQGSPTDIVDSSGNLLDHEVYSPFGQVVYVSNAGVYHLQGYAGGISDPNTGFVKFGERWYDPLTAVWISIDPAGFRAGDGNLARYKGNSAPNGTDPSGLRSFWDWWYDNPPLEDFPPPPPPTPPPTSVKTLYIELLDPNFQQRLDEAACDAAAMANTAVYFYATAPILGIGNSGPITGFTKHGINSAISHAGGGVAPHVILDTINSPVQIILQPGGTFKIVGRCAVVVLNQAGKVVTAYPLK